MLERKLWRVEFDCKEKLKGFPYVRWICSEDVTDHNYYSDSKHRLGDRHLLFKYTLSGCGGFKQGGNTYQVPEGHGFLCRIGDPDYAYFYPENASVPWHFIYISFSYDLPIINEILKKYGYIYALSKDSAIIQTMLSYKFQQKYQLVSQSFGFSLISSLITAIIQSAENKFQTSPASDIVEVVTKIVFDNIVSDIRVSEIADRVDISCEHLSRIFKKETGSTLHKFILRQRMLYAADLLKRNDLSIKQVGIIMNYDTSSHFARSFKKIMGVTPSDYRSGNINSFY